MQNLRTYFKKCQFFSFNPSNKIKKTNKQTAIKAFGNRINAWNALGERTASKKLNKNIFKKYKYTEKSAWR